MLRSILFCFCLYLLCSSCQAQETTSCPFLKLKKGSEDLCGYLEVPLDYKNPGGEQITIPYWVIKSKHPESQADPIVFIQGGPGGKVLALAQNFRQLAFDVKRDFILFDQRGIGSDDPFCPDFTDNFLSIFAQDLSAAEETQAIREALLLCGGDNAAYYTTEANVADLEALRKHLGIQEWNLFGGSYGTRLGLAYMQKFPGRVRSAILNGLFPEEVELFKSYLPNFDRSLNQVFDLCASDPDCRGTYPDLKAETFSVIDELRQRPLALVLNQEELILNAQDFLLILQQMLYHKTTAVLIPSFVTAVKHKRTVEVSTVIGAISQGLQGINMAVFYAVMAAEEGQVDQDALLKDHLKTYPQYAPGISLFLSGADPFDRYPQSDFSPEKFNNKTNIPMLLVSGALDPITPPSNVRYLKSESPYQYYLEIPLEGHTPLNACFFGVAQNFLDRPKERPNMDCRLGRVPLQWP